MKESETKKLLSAEVELDHLSSTATDALWNILALFLGGICIAFWVDMSQPDVESNLNFMKNFKQDEVFIIALPATSILLIALLYLAELHRRAVIIEKGNEVRFLAELLPSVPKVELSGIHGRKIQIAYFAIFTVGPIIMIGQSFFDFQRASIFETEKSSVAADGLIEMLSLPLNSFKSFGSGLSYRFLSSHEGKEAFPPVQPWGYLLLTIGAFASAGLFWKNLMMSRNWSVVEPSRSCQPGSENSNELPEASEDAETETESEQKVQKSSVTKLLLLFVLFALSSAQTAAADSIVELKLPANSLERLLREKIPDSVDLAGKQKLATVPIWKNIRLENVEATIPDESIKLSLQAPNIATLNLKLGITAKLKYEYEHVRWVMEMKRVGPLKTKIPVEKRDWRTREGTIKAPVSLKATFIIALKPSSEGSLSLRLKPIHELSSAKIGEIKVTNANEFLQTIVEKIGNHFANEELQGQFTSKVLQDHEFDLDSSIPKRFQSFIQSAQLKIAPDSVSIEFPNLNLEP